MNAHVMARTTGDFSSDHSDDDTVGSLEIVGVRSVRGREKDIVAVNKIAD